MTGEISNDFRSQDIDVAVIGGGISGVYSAWRLRELGDQSPALSDLAKTREDRKLRVGLFEYSNRIGGRLYSATLPGVPQAPVELGGMRFLKIHRLVYNLVKYLQLGYHRLPVTDLNKRNLYYLRGHYSTAADWDRLSFTPPYQLDRQERGRPPGELLIETALRHQHEPEKLFDIGFWNLLLDEWSEEAYLLIREASGYDTIVNNWSAAEAIPFLLADFRSNADYFALDEGFQSLPLKIERLFRQAGGQTFLGHRLHRLDHEPDDKIRLTFDSGDPGQFHYHRRVQKEAVCRARHVVLAMPRRSIELLHPDSFIFDSEQFQNDLRAVLPQIGFKIFAAYKRPWWYQTRGVTTGRSITNLPVRQCYYWHTDVVTLPDGKEKFGPSVLMASYNDGASGEFWAGLARRPQRYQPPPEVCPPGVPIPDHVEPISASDALVSELQDQLRELHGLNDLTDPISAQILLPYVAVYQDWSQEPFGGGWHFWKIGVNAPSVMRRIQKPFSDTALYICGEAWSRQQGWVEGALETADTLLEDVLRLPRPSWLS